MQEYGIIELDHPFGIQNRPLSEIHLIEVLKRNLQKGRLERRTILKVKNNIFPVNINSL